MYASFKAVEPLYTFPQFLAFCEQLVAEGRTSGPNQSEFLIFFTKLNYQRMVRWNRTAELLPETVLAVQKAPAQQWFVITEAWCGDSAQNLPLIAKIAEAAGSRITLQILLRDEHPELMDAYLTNGSRSIPKLVAFDEASGTELFTWGPRPQSADALYQGWKKDPAGRDFESFEKELHTWYARDKGHETQAELTRLLLETKSL